MSSIKEEKNRLRKKILAERARLTIEERKNLSRKIMENLLATEIFSRAETVFLFVSFGSEVETLELIGQSLLLGKKVALPRTLLSEKKLVFHRLYTLGELVPGAYGILEAPTRNPVIPPEEADLVVVPGVAFDRKGHRLGYGGGFYDRILTRVRAPKVALAFDLQVLPEVPAEKHDQRVNYIITEKEVIFCR